MIKIIFPKKTIRLIIFVYFLFHTSDIFSQELSRYACFVDRVFVDEFEKMKGKSFNKDGIIKQNNQYHPLTIVQYGMLCHNEFLETGDSTYYYKCINQIIYFKDSIKVNYLYEGKGIGLPYKFKALDMKPPWYSGMTQGYAISFLLRYHELTGDNEILPIIEKIAFLLKLSVNEGGVITVNKEGYKFIEEYPNSKSHPQVLNGAINGLIGLKEYCDYFPEDTTASFLLNELYLGLKESIPYYDTPEWSTYSRRNQKLNNLYLRYQINEMEHLHNLFEDDFFYHQLMIWSTFAYNKPNKGKLYKRGDLNYSIPLTVSQSSNLTSLIKVDTVVTFSEASFYSFLFKREKQINNYFLKGKTPKRNYSKSRLKLLDFKQDTIIKLIDIVSIPDVVGFKIGTFRNDNFEILDYEVLEQKSDTILIKLTEENKINNIIYYTPKLSDETKHLRVQYLLNYPEEKVPFFAHFQSNVFHLKKDDELKIAAEYRHGKKMRIFYRVSTTKQDVSKETWKAKNVLEDVVFEMPHDGYCQFLISFDIENPFFQLLNLQFEGPESFSAND